MCNISFFSDFFEDFLLILAFSNLTVMCLGIIFFVFILESAELLESVNLCLTKFGTFSTIISSNTFYAPFPLSLCWAQFTYILLILSYIPLRDFMFPPFFLCT